MYNIYIEYVVAMATVHLYVCMCILCMYIYMCVYICI